MMSAPPPVLSIGATATETTDMNPASPRLERARWYVVLVLGLVYALNIADRYVVSTVLEPIRLEFNLTDTGVGWLTGVSLALFYITVGIPISQLADRSNRRNIVAGAMVLWSMMTAILGVTQSFWQFLIVRIGVGIGEAGARRHRPRSSPIIFRARQARLCPDRLCAGPAAGGVAGVERRRPDRRSFP